MCTAIIEIFSYVVHYDTQEVPKIQVVNFLYVTLLTHLFLSGFKCLGKFVDPSHSVYM
jgi:hypothetical protein